MNYHIECTCGRRIVVGPAESGTQRVCDCGASVAVPSLSRLRELAQQDAFESGVIDTIRRMIRDGALPWGETCAATGVRTDDVFVECERFHAARDRQWIQVLALIVTLLVLLAMRDEQGEAQGRETVAWT